MLAQQRVRICKNHSLYFFCFHICCNLFSLVIPCSGSFHTGKVLVNWLLLSRQESWCVFLVLYDRKVNGFLKLLFLNKCINIDALPCIPINECILKFTVEIILGNPQYLYSHRPLPSLICGHSKLLGGNGYNGL